MKTWQILFLFTLSASSSCHAPRPPAVSLSGVTLHPKCQGTYRKFLQGDVVHFVVVFGYKDSRPARLVGDRYERAHFIDLLLHAGWSRSPEAEDDLIHRVRGPDGHETLIRMTIVGSSVGPDDDENRKDPFQAWSSLHAQTQFLDALREADLVFYYGHSRDGGGPDFFPPELTRNLHVNYPLYRKNKKAVEEMLKALRSGSGKLKLLGLFSCVSDTWFTHAILKAQPLLPLIISHTLLYYNDALIGMRDAIEGLVEQKCQEDFHLPGTEFIHFFDGERR